MPQKRAPYAEFRANGHHGLSTGGQCHRPSRPDPDLNQRCRKAKKLLPRRRKPCARLVSDKYRAVELILKNPDAGTDCRLREIEVDRRIDKAARFDNLQKRTGDTNLHRSISLRESGNNIHLIANNNRSRSEEHASELQSLMR